MANEVMQSLFGLDSQAASEALRQQQMAEDYKYATLDPRQQIIFNARQAGRGIASGINQMFGLVPEQLQSVRAREDALAETMQSGVDLNDPVATTTRLIKALSRHGLQQDAGKLFMAFQENYPKLLRAQQAKAVGSMLERDRELLTDVDAAIANGTATPGQVQSALVVLDKRVQPQEVPVFDPYGNQVATRSVPGQTGLLNIYPNLAKALSGLTPQKPPVVSAKPPVAPEVISMPPGADTTPEGQSFVTEKVATPFGEPSTVSVYGVPSNDIINATPLEPLATPGTPAAPAAPVTPVPTATPVAPVVPAPVAAAAPTQKPVIAAFKPRPILKPPPKNASAGELAVWDREKANHEVAYREWRDEQTDMTEAEKRQNDLDHQREMRRMEQDRVKIAQQAEARQQRKDDEALAKERKANIVQYRSVKASSVLVLDNIKDIVDILKKNPTMTTGWAALLASLPGTDARSLKGKLEFIKSNVALAALKELKAASPTGASGMGAMNIQELEMLLNSLGTVDQAGKAADLAKVMKQIAKHVYDAKTYAEQDLDALTKGSANK